MNEGSRLLSGVVVPVVTAMDADARPSVTAAEPHLRALAAAGVKKLLVFGSNGEGPLIPATQIEGYLVELVGRWRELVPDGVVIINATAPGTTEALERAQLVARADADGVAVSPPIYFHHRDDEIIDHFRRFENVAIPTVAYNVPRYANPMSRAVIEKLAELEHVVGAKDSSGDLDVLADFLTIRQHRPGFAVSEGGEGQLLAALSAGADGVVPGTANLAPSLSLDLVTAWHEGRQDEAEAKQGQITRLSRLHEIRPGVPSVKALLAQRGLVTDHLAPPFAACTSGELGRLLEFSAAFEADLLPPARTGSM